MKSIAWNSLKSSTVLTMIITLVSLTGLKIIDVKVGIIPLTAKQLDG
ncbi:MAG: hypothetical protein PHR52_05120 [Fermentimonas sp.]|nr:hypothetical protein [Fermentimonas sp.]